jgi:hypothetical protein
MIDRLSRAFAPLSLPLALVLTACAAATEPASPNGITPSGPPAPIFGGIPRDDLIQPGEEHFVHLWMLTTDGENAEAYWSSDGERLVFQRRAPELGIDCDRIFVTRPDAPPLQLSSGRGTTTCAYFMPGDRSVIYASTQAAMDECPPPIDPAEFRSG